MPRRDERRCFKVRAKRVAVKPVGAGQKQMLIKKMKLIGYLLYLHILRKRFDIGKF